MRKETLEMKKLLSVFLVILMLVSVMPLSFSVYAAPADGEVLYENDFEDGDISDLRVIRGSKDRVYVEDGALVLNAMGVEFVSVLLPEELSEYDSCEIVANVTMTEARDSARWCSLMFRVQNSDYPYYHMCVRKNTKADNGVEFATRTQDNNWNVTHKNAGSAVIGQDKTTELKLRFYRSTVEEYVNGELVVTADTANGLDKGEMGITANYCTLRVHDIKVTYIDPSELVVSPASGAVLLENDTGVIGGYDLSEFVNSESELDAILKAEKKPHTAIFYVNEDLKATAENGYADFASAVEAAERLNGEIMPAFYVYNATVAAKLASELKSLKINDCFIISNDASAVSAARKAHSLCRGVLDLTEALKGKTELTDAELIKIRDDTNKAGASIAMIPAECATDKNVEYIIDRLVSVWIKGSISTVTDAYAIAAAGAHGAVTDNTAVMYDIFESYMEGNKLLRSPLVVGHRGTVKYAPENTIEGSELAYKNGADAIETDIYITTDGEIVCIHDGTTQRTCGKSLNVEGSTLAQLKELYANNEWKNNSEYKDVKIPTLDEYFEHFKDKDVQLFVEIKSTKPSIIPALVDLIKEYDIADQVSVITFHGAQVRRMKEACPEISCGLLCGNLTSGDGATSAMNVLSTVQPIYSTYNPSYGGHSDDFIVNANMRGTNVYPWTINGQNEFYDFFVSGYNGLTTDDSKLAVELAKTLTSSAYSIDILPGETHTVKASLETYGRKISDVSSKVRVILLDGADKVTVGEGNVLSFSAEGTYTYALEYEYRISRNAEYTIHTMPITVNVTAPAEETEESAETLGTAAADDTEADGTDPKNNTLTVILIAVGAVVLAAVVIFIIFSKKKK